MVYEHVVYEVDRGARIATVTLNKPERLNAIDQQDHRDLMDLCQRIQEDDGVWVVIWTGAGRGFCAGADIRQPRPPEDQSPSLNRLRAEGLMGQPPGQRPV